MSKTAEQIEAFRAEAQAWLLKNSLTGDLWWRTPKEQWDEEREGYAGKVYLVLAFEGDFHRVIWLLPDHPGYKWDKQYHEEFEAMVERHVLCFEMEDHTVMYFMSQDEYYT